MPIAPAPIPPTRYAATRTVGATILIAGALAASPWTLSLLAGPDGGLDGRHAQLAILGLQALLAGIGLRLLLPLRVAAAVAGLFLVGSLAAMALVSFEVWPRPSADGRLRTVLQRLEDVGRLGFVQLGSVTSEVLQPHRSPQVDVPLAAAGPRGRALHLAFGFDDRLPAYYDADVTFEVLRQDDTAKASSAVLFRQEFTREDLSAAAGRWFEASIDLADGDRSGASLRFRKTARVHGRRDSSDLADLAPHDLMYWRAPHFETAAEQAPNVILVSIDTLRADHVGLLGYRRDTTPRLDQLGASSLVFEQCYAQAPWTTPSHFAMLTGRMPSRGGADQPVQSTHRTFFGGQTLATLLRQRGFRTAAFTGSGSISARFGFGRGFEAYTEHSGASDAREVFRDGIDWVRKHRQSRFFLFLHTYEPHSPYRDEFFLSGMQRPTELEARQALYDGDIHRADAELGKLIEALRELDLLDPTILIVTSDHGEELESRERPGTPVPAKQAHGHTLYDELLHVPLLIRYPPGVAPGRSTALVRSIDIVPTVLALLDLPTAEALDGRSLVTSAASVAPDLALAAPAEATTYGPRRLALRTPEFKYIWRTGHGELLLPGQGRFKRLTPPEELYDLREDPGERVNRAAELPETVARLRRLGLAFWPPSASGFDTSATTVDLSAEPGVIEQLSALGYID